MLVRARLLPLSLLVLSVGALGACATGADVGSTDGSESELGSDQQAVITFGANFDTKVTGKLVAGKKARIHYAPERLPSCRTNANGGGPAWVISGFASTNGKAADTFYVAGHASDPTIDSSSPPDPVISLPSGGDLAIWFQVHDTSGCNAYDSAYGNNFHFQVAGAPPDPPGSVATVTFGASGAPSVDGDLVAGGNLEVHYDASRLPQCRGGLDNGQPAWNISGYASVNGKDARPFYVAGFNPDSSVDVTHPPPARVPLPEAGEVAIWFEVHSSFGCQSYDSNSSANYKFSIKAH